MCVLWCAAPPGVPYDLSPEFVEELFSKHKIDYIIHGDDPCLLPDGTDAYAHAKKLGRFKMVRRTGLDEGAVGRGGAEVAPREATLGLVT